MSIQMHFKTASKDNLPCVNVQADCRYCALVTGSSDETRMQIVTLRKVFNLTVMIADIHFQLRKRYCSEVAEMPAKLNAFRAMFE